MMICTQDLSSREVNLSQNLNQWRDKNEQVISLNKQTIKQTNKQTKLDISQNLKQWRDKNEQVADSPSDEFLH